MSDSPLDLEPPSETLAALLRADRAETQATAAGLDASQASVLARLTATLGPLDAPAPGPSAPPPPAPLPTPTHLPPAAPAPTAPFLASMLTKGGLAMLGLGLLVGGATTAVLLPRAPAAPPTAHTLPTATTPGVAMTAAASAAPVDQTATAPTMDEPRAAFAGGVAEPTASARKTVTVPETRAEDGRDPDLERERALLDVARGALARGNASLALRTVEEHAARFPRGRLVENREALRIKALVAAGRTSEAERSRAAFRTSYPDSFALPTGTEPAPSASTGKVPRPEKSRDTLTDPFARPQ